MTSWWISRQRAGNIGAVRNSFWGGGGLVPGGLGPAPPRGAQAPCIDGNTVVYFSAMSLLPQVVTDLARGPSYSLLAKVRPPGSSFPFLKSGSQGAFVADFGRLRIETRAALWFPHTVY
jgi:hypothetical protein